MVGIEKKPYLSLEQLIKTDVFLELQEELIQLLAIAPSLKVSYRHYMSLGVILPKALSKDIEEITKYGYFDKMSVLNRKDEYPKILQNHSSFLLRYEHLKTKSWIQWSEGIALKDSSSWNKNREKKVNYHEDIIPYTKKCRKLIDELPFEHHGRVILFSYPPNSILIPHKDSYMEPHQDEFITLQFNNREKFFIYDELQNKKHYINSKVFFYNDRDFHGLDPMPYWTFSLRIDGPFKESFKKNVLSIKTNDYSYGFRDLKENVEQKKGFFWI